MKITPATIASAAATVQARLTACDPHDTERRARLLTLSARLLLLQCNPHAIA